MTGRGAAWFGVIVLAGIGVFLLVLAGQETVAMISPSTTYEGEVVSRDRREQTHTNSNGVTRTSVYYRTVVRHADGEIAIGASEVYDGVREGDRVRVDVNDRSGHATGLRAGDLAWERGAPFLIVMTGALALVVFGAAAVAARTLQRHRLPDGGPQAPSTSPETADRTGA
jgi:hypothetical protein